MRLNALADIDQDTLSFFLKITGVVAFILFLLVVVLFDVDFSAFFNAF